MNSKKDDGLKKSVEFVFFFLNSAWSLSGTQLNQKKQQLCVGFASVAAKKQKTGQLIFMLNVISTSVQPCQQ